MTSFYLFIGFFYSSGSQTMGYDSHGGGGSPNNFEGHKYANTHPTLAQQLLLLTVPQQILSLENAPVWRILSY